MARWKPRLIPIHLWLARQPSGVLLIISLLLLAGCALVDYFSGAELSLSIAYLVPTALATWYAGGIAGATISLCGSVVWLLIELGSGHTFNSTMIPVWNSGVRLGFFLLYTFLLCQIHRLFLQLQTQAETDTLTGLANSRNFFTRLEMERQRALRYGHPFTVAYLDLDNFKQVNDKWGHETGDQVLKSIAQSMRNNLRKTDLVARLGGDEFGILLVESGEEEAEETLNNLLRRLRQVLTGQKWPVSLSIGAVICHDAEDFSAQSLVKLADEQMYAVKHGGKNRLKIHTLVASNK